MTLPSVSVIIPTYGREEALRDSIKDTIAQDYPNFEVLVIDQTSIHEPETDEFLQQLADNNSIKWFRLPWASLPGARNYGVRKSTGEIIIFIDDDVQLPTEYIKSHVENFQKRPEVGVVAGRVFDRMKLSDSPQNLVIEDLPPEAMDPGIAWYYIDLVHTIKPQQVISARGCNMSYRRSIFSQHGVWFDERFRGSAVREESDFCLRLRRTGYQIWYDPEANLVHLGEETGGCHDISTRSLQYQVTFYHNHFLMALKNLSFAQQLRLYTKLFDCHVFGNPPCNKSGSPIKIMTRGFFYTIGFFDALKTMIKSLWDDGQIYTRQEKNN